MSAEDEASKSQSPGTRDGIDLPSSAAFWSARVFVVHESSKEKERYDPSTTMATAGETALDPNTPAPVRALTALIYGETLRDGNVALRSGGRTDVYTAEQIMLHELGHMGGADHPDGGVMGKMKRSEARILEPPSLDKMRGVLQWGKEK